MNETCSWAVWEDRIESDLESLANGWKGILPESAPGGLDGVDRSSMELESWIRRSKTVCRCSTRDVYIIEMTISSHGTTDFPSPQHMISVSCVKGHITGFCLMEQSNNFNLEVRMGALQT